MKTRAYVMLGIALLLAGASVFLARNWVQNQVQPVAAIEDQKKLETTKVIVASTQLHFGNKVRREHLRVVDWPIAAVPEGSFKSIDDILGKDEVDEKTVMFHRLAELAGTAANPSQIRIQPPQTN
jgi:pilus assembly protein CpaB